MLLDIPMFVLKLRMISPKSLFRSLMHQFFEQLNLPFMSPLQYQTAIQFEKENWNANITVLGNGVQNRYSPYFGENKKPDYYIINASVGYQFNLQNNQLALKLGAENIFDRYYSTYTDWNNIPRMGRNIYLNLNFRIR